MVICVYTDDRWDHIVNAVRSVLAQDLAPLQVIISVDHNQGLLRRLTEHFPDLTVIENTGTQGLAGARNAGIDAAHGDLVAFLDDDAVAPTDWLGGLLAPFEDPEVVASGTAAVPRWETGRPTWWPPEFDWVVGCAYTGLPTAQADVRNVIGCSMAIRRSCMSAVGRFTDGIGRIGTRPVGCEETELCIRARQHDPSARVVYVPSVAVDHFVPASRATARYFLRRCFHEGVSKAAVARITGPTEALSSEATYLRETLVRGIVARVSSGMKDPSGLSRALAIMVGAVTTCMGYAWAQARMRTSQVTRTLRMGPRASRCRG